MTEAVSGQEEQSDELVLALTDVAHLFNAPSIDPSSPSPAEALGVAGIEHVLGLLHMDRKRQQARTLVLEFPRGRTLPQDRDLAERVRCYVEARLEAQRRELRNTYRYGWRVAALAILLLAMALGLSSFFAGPLTEGMRPLLRKTFEYGFEIIGWVILWHPVELLAFSPIPIRTRIAALQALAGMQVVVRAAPVP